MPDSLAPAIAAIAPVDQLHITTDPLCVSTVYQLADVAANGAVVLMSGMVRNQTGGRPVAYLEYQAYEPMAIAIFEQIAATMRDHWSSLNRIVIHHRIGRLEIGAISVLVAVGAPHRADAFEACRYAIDTLKQQAPIWKQEHWADGDSDWVVTTARNSAQAPE